MGNRVFLDTSFAIALSVESDQHHTHALELSEQLESENTRLITTTAVLLEIGNALSKKRFRKAAAELLSSLEHDETVEIAPLTDELYQQAFNVFCSHTDKDWGLIDCISFIVMQENGLTEALTTDEHFEQVGFTALLRNR